MSLKDFHNVIPITLTYCIDFLFSREIILNKYRKKTVQRHFCASALL